MRVVGTAEDEATALQWLAQPGNRATWSSSTSFSRAARAWACCARRRQLPPRRHMVVLSNYATPDMRRKCLELGADRVFDKSNEIDALIQYCDQLAGPATRRAA